MPFKGINNLRDHNESVSVEPWQLEELRKCAKDPMYFIENYVYINTKDHGMQLFKMWDFQRDYLKKLVEYRFNIAKWARQIGKSCTTISYLLWYSVFNKDKVVVILANKLSLAQEQLHHFREAYVCLPYWMQCGVAQWNKREVRFSHGTRIKCLATAPDTIRGISANLIYLDEFSFVRPHIAEEFIASVFPTISSGKTTKVIMTSCVTKDTYIYTDKGIKQLQDFIDETHQLGYKVPAYKIEGKTKLNTGSVIHNDGEKETRKIITTNSELEGSLEHRLWACKNGNYNWYKLKELNENDFVSIKYGMNIWGNNDVIDYVPKKTSRQTNYFSTKILNKDFCYFIGLFIAEGYALPFYSKIKKDKIIGGRVIITCGDDVSKYISALKLKFSVRDGIHYVINSLSLLNTLKHLGFDLTKKAPSKIIPKRLMELSSDNIVALLQGLFDGDGYAQRTRYSIGIKLSSESLIKQIRILLLNFGIVTTFRESMTKPTKKVVKKSQGFQLNTDYINTKKFYEMIGFRFNRKQKYKNLITFKSKGEANDLIPYARIKLIKLNKKFNLKLYDKFLIGPNTKMHLSRTRVLKIKNILKNKNINELNTFFDDNVQDNIRWAKIKKIEKSKKYVYDFSLDDVINDKWCHSVLYNGMIGHNTPCGMNHFYRMWQEALGDYSMTEEGNGYVRSENIWNAVPGRDEKWAREEKARIGEIRFNQEFLCQFIGSVSTLIDHNFLRDLKPVEPMKIPKLPDCVKIWELPRNPKQIEVKNWEYVASIDSGYGIHADYTVLQICLVKSNITIHQVAKLYSNSMDIDEFCQKARNLLKCYGDPRLIIEQNGPGIAAMQFFHLKAEYENILHFHPTGKQMGLWATDRLKETACILLKTCVQRGFLKLKDRETIEELHSFGKTTQKKWGGLGGNHDDHVTSIYWIVYYVNTPFFYGNVVEVDMKRVSEDEYLLTTEEERSTADKVMADVRDPNFHMTELQKGAEFLPENQINGIYDENDGEGENLGSGLMFRT